MANKDNPPPCNLGHLVQETRRMENYQREHPVVYINLRAKTKKENYRFAGRRTKPSRSSYLRQGSHEEIAYFMVFAYHAECPMRLMGHISYCTLNIPRVSRPNLTVCGDGSNAYNKQRASSAHDDS